MSWVDGSRARACRRRLWMAALPAAGLAAAVCVASPAPAALAHSSLAPVASSPGSAPAFDLPAPGGGYSQLDGPDSQNAAVTSIDLAGTWGFTPAGGSPGTIAVPGGGWYKQGYTSVAEATYSRQITIPDTSQPQVDEVIFGAVNHQATLYVDGTKVGTNTTSFTPSSFDLTPYVQPGHTYTISVDVKGRKALTNPANGKYVVPDAAEWSEAVPQGIFRSAYLRIYPQVHIAGTSIQTSVANNTLRYETSITNAGDTPQTVTLTGHLTSWNHAGWNYPDIAGQRVTVPAHATQDVTVTVPWTLGPQSYWWPNVPYRPGYRAQLHVLNLAIHGPAGVADEATYRFGFREVGQRDPYYYLNGVRVNFRGDDLQGADYDRVDHSGKGDAYDTLPGFLPPGNGNPGWPQAVDNYERLNYNVVRIHQEPATPYMLDVADEMGLMVIDETAIRGSNGGQDFVAGHDYMVGHAGDLALRDRNHPAVVRWSEANEPYGASEQFIGDLYNAITAVDPTRPISVDGESPSSYPDMTQPDFNALPHYLGGLGEYTGQVLPQDNRPFGQGEYIWPACSTVQGFTWFATATEAMRAEDASDLRPYTLLSAWAGFVPGVKTTDFTTEEGRPPVYGADNLPDPWANPQIQRAQAAFNPALVADTGYWASNHLSDANGDWPTPHHPDQPTLVYGSQVTRTLDVFNDTFTGTNVDVTWQARLGSATGPVAASGTLPLNVPLGSHISPQISFTAPETGSQMYLVLTASKPGQGTLFRETGEYFNLAATQPSPSYTVDDAEQGTGIDQFSYSGAGWSHQSGVRPPGQPYQGTMSTDATTGDTTSMTFTGTQLRFYGVTAPGGGRATVSLDGQVTATVDFYGPARAGDVLLWTSPVLPAGTHTFTLRVSGTSDPAASGHQVAVDDVDVTGPPPPYFSVDDATQGTAIDQFNYVGSGWGHQSGEEGPAYPYDGTNSYDATAGDYAAMTFNGTQIAYYAVTDSKHGIAAVSIDGGPETLVDLYSPNRTGDVPVWRSPVLAAGTHTLKIRVTGTKNAASSYHWITIDRAEITGSPPPVVTVDDAVQGTGVNQFNYVGSGWGHASGEGGPAYPYDGTNSYDLTPGDYATMTFNGTQIAYYAVTDSKHGIAAVSIDGGPETLVDLYSPSRTGDVPVWRSPVLPAGTHTLKIRVTGTKNTASSGYYVTIDRADITNSNS